MARLFIVLFGVFCAATSVIMTKASQLSPEILSSSRLFVAVLVLLPFYLRDKKSVSNFSWQASIASSSLPALLLALHFITWTIGARWTSSANSTLIVNLIPIAMPFFSYFMLKEYMNKGEWMGTLLTFSGVAVLAYADYQLSTTLLHGDLVCLLSMLLMAWYLILARKNNSIPSIWLYLVPLYAQAGVICLVAGLIRTGIPDSIEATEWLYILLLGLVPTVFGHSLLNLAMQWFRSQLVAILTQLQFIYAGILGYLFFTEIPEISFYLASVFMMTGVVWTIFSQTPSEAQKG